MSSLQIGLIAAGVLLVVAVIVYNLWQERRITRRLAESRAATDRARAEPPRRAAERVEPTLMPKAAAATADEAATPVHRAAPTAQAPFVPPGDVIPPPAEFERAASTADDATLAAVEDGDADAALATTLDAPTAGAMSVTPSAYPQPDHEI
ncbi:MAG TPA: hypothetical protein VGL90_00250, partial [Casimicrobiaceae bacterium]